MTAEWLLQRLATSVLIIAVSTAYYALLIKWSLMLTAKMLGTPTPRPGSARMLGMGLCVAVSGHAFFLAFDLAATGVIASGVKIANVVIPTRWFVTRPLEFFLLAGLMIRFLPTTFKRGCLVALNFQLLTAAVAALIIAAAILARMLG